MKIINNIYMHDQDYETICEIDSFRCRIEVTINIILFC